MPNIPKGYIPVRHSHCHSGNVLVMTSDTPPFSIYAGGRTRGAVPYVGSLVLDFSGLEAACPLTVAGGMALPRTRTYNAYTLVQLDWDDYQAPPVDQEFWTGLRDDIRDLSLTLQQQGERLRVVVMCSGGHGRTGTALAILGCLLGFIPATDDPVAWVRAHYCVNAVESYAQIQYIERITGRKVQEQPGQVYPQRSGHAFGHHAAFLDDTDCDEWWRELGSF